MKRVLARTVAFALLAALSFVTLVALAQPKKPARPRPPRPVATKPEAGAELAPAREERAPASRDAGSTGVVSETTKDGGARVFRFGEVEVEGRLKSPQIVYFLRRVRAEFSAGDLGHRSFRSELGETRHEPGF